MYRTPPRSWNEYLDDTNDHLAVPEALDLLDRLLRCVYVCMYVCVCVYEYHLAVPEALDLLDRLLRSVYVCMYVCMYV